MTTAEYMRDYRSRNTEYVEANRRRSVARRRALQRLKEAHRAEYFEMYEEELRRIPKTPRRPNLVPRLEQGGADRK
jgi:hypothetical protein